MSAQGASAKCGEEALANSLALFSTGCDAIVGRLVERVDDSLFIQWKIYKPALEKFLTRMLRLVPTLSIAPTENSTIDLRRFWCLLEEEQRKLFARVKQLGFGTGAVITLTHYRHMPRAEAISYIARLNVDNLREP